MPSANECPHARQRQVNGVWLCRVCGSEVVSEPIDAKDFGSVRFGGLSAFRNFRNLGESQQRMTERNIARFRKEKGYDPVSEKEFYG